MGNNRNDIDAILSQWLNGEISDDEARKHLSKDDFLKYQQIVAEIEQWTPDSDTQIFDPASVTGAEKKGKVVKFNAWRLSVAASIMLFVIAGLWFWQPWDQVAHQTAYGVSLTIDLPDGSSKLVLGANSKVSWKKSVWRKGKRRIDLQGKAYLDVPQKGSFEVITDAGKVEVLGTRFVVYQLEEVLHAACYEGRVRATAKNNESVEISKGESSLFFKGKWDPKELFNLDLPDWLRDQITFDNAPLKLVIDELKSTYGIQVDSGDIDLSRRFTGSIPKDDLDQSLKIIFPTLGMTYRLEDNTLYLSE